MGLLESPSALPTLTSPFVNIPTHCSVNILMLVPAALAGIVTKICLDEAIRSSNVSSNVRHLAPLLVIATAVPAVPVIVVRAVFEEGL